MRDTIINASIESLRREGLKFSIDTLADRLKISKKTIYKFFPDKETLAFAIYEKYYADAKEKAGRIITGNAASAYSDLLYLYFDSKAMTRNDIFNKYKLNRTLYSYTSKHNDTLWETISTFFDSMTSKEDMETLLLTPLLRLLCPEPLLQQQSSMKSLRLLSLNSLSNGQEKLTNSKRGWLGSAPQPSSQHF